MPRSSIRLAFVFCFTFSNLLSQRQIDVDICVYGGTSAGIVAAYTATRHGKSVIIVEPSGHLGGMTTGGLGYTDIGNKSAITGIARDFYRRIGKHYGRFEQWTFEPHVASEVFKQYITKANLEILTHSQLAHVFKTGTTIKSLMVNRVQGDSSENTLIQAKVFIDCSYEGDLMAAAGVSYAVGREGNDVYGESYNGVQLLDGHQFPDGIDPYVVKGKKSSGMLWGISADTLHSPGAGDVKLQAYNFRICLTSIPEDMIEITRPDGYDSTKYELLLRLFEALPTKRKLDDYFIWSKMPNNKTDINNRGAFSTDMIGMNYAYPEASYAERQRIQKEHEIYTKGLLYFFGHDPRVPEELRKQMLMWGYPRDEFKENNHWSPQLYVRESRRMIGEYVMTQHNCEGRKHASDGIGMAAYTMDSHNCQRIIINGQVKNEGNVEVGGFGPYPISYRAIVPKQEEVDNMLVPVCLSASHIAYGSIRMEPVFMVLAQSAATAAAMAIDEALPVQEVNVKKLQRQLKINPLADGSLPDIVVDNGDSRHTRIEGKKWILRKEGGYGASYLVTEPDEKKPKSIRFQAAGILPAMYNVYVYIPKIDNSTDFMLATVSDGIKATERIVNPANIVVDGQTSGEWVSLGRYTIEKGRTPFVELTTKGANKLIVADAVIWTPVLEN